MALSSQAITVHAAPEAAHGTLPPDAYPVGGGSSAKQERGGDESERRLDRLSARAKQAGLTTKGA
jgi:hypothetical protein